MRDGLFSEAHDGKKFLRHQFRSLLQKCAGHFGAECGSFLAMNRLRFLRRPSELQTRMLGPLFVAMAIGLAGCDDPSADLQMRLTYAQKELDVANAEILKLRSEMDKPREQAAVQEAGLPAVSEKNFREEAKKFAEQLQAELKDVTVSAPAYSEVKTVATFHFMLTMADGRNDGQNVVASATPDGRWIFPTAGEFVRSLAAAASREPVSPVSVPPVVPPAPTPTPKPPTIDPLGAGPGTDVIWPKKAGQPVAPQNQGVPVQPPQSAPPRAPSVNPMKANEERNISFERKK